LRYHGSKDGWQKEGDGVARRNAREIHKPGNVNLPIFHDPEEYFPSEMIHLRIGSVNFETCQNHATFLLREKSAIFGKVADHEFRGNGHHAGDKTFLESLDQIFEGTTIMKIQAHPDFPATPFMLAIAYARSPPKEPAKIDAEKNQT
jgi:hypothetical protein